MVLAIAALLLHIPAIPQSSNSTISRVLAEASLAGVANTNSQPSTNATAVSLDRPNAEGPTIAPESRSSEELSEVSNVLIEETAAPGSLSNPAFLPEPKLPDYAGELRRREWLGLSIAQHGAATFDAWSTRRALALGEGRELNPTLRPFSGNSSLYAAIQVGPVLFDYVGRRMMTSRYGWARHTWWIPQAVSTAMSLASGAHNLTIHQP